MRKTPLLGSRIAVGLALLCSLVGYGPAAGQSTELHPAAAKMLIDRGADVNAIDGDGKNALGLAIFNGAYELASFLVDNHADVNQADAQRFTPLFWAVDRRNMETAARIPTLCRKITRQH